MKNRMDRRIAKQTHLQMDENKLRLQSTTIRYRHGRRVVFAAPHSNHFLSVAFNCQSMAPCNDPAVTR